MTTTRDRTDDRSALPDLFAAYNPLHVRYAAGEQITHVASYAAGVYSIQHGLVQEAACTEPFGLVRRGAIEVLGPGDLLSLEPLLPGDQELQLSFSRALTETRLSFLERSALLVALERDGVLRRRIMEYLADRLHRARTAVDAREARLGERLGSLLVRLAFAWAPGSDPAILPEEIDRRALSGLLGVSTSRVTRALRALGVREVADSPCLVVDVATLRGTIGGAG